MKQEKALSTLIAHHDQDSSIRKLLLLENSQALKLVMLNVLLIRTPSWASKSSKHPVFLAVDSFVDLVVIITGPSTAESFSKSFPAKDAKVEPPLVELPTVLPNSPGRVSCNR
jgi:hypothetical protein